jgi:RNA polymerase sigma factor (sigma-70 family)
VTVPKQSLSAEPFQSVLDAARVGAAWAWRTIVDGLEPRLRAYAHRQGTDDPDAVVGDTWLNVARSIDRFEGDEAAFRSWVFSIAHHRLIDDRRRRRRKPAEPTALDRIDRASPTAPSAETEAMEHFGDAEVRRTLQQLPDAQREVMLLRFVGGFGITEIASIIGKRPGAVQALQRRALARLRKILE